MTGSSLGAFDERAAPFWHAALDSLPDSLAVLDHHGDILAVNATWRGFAEANGGFDVGVGTNYLSVCDRSGASDPIAVGVARALREVLTGTRARYECVYPCHAPWQERWFWMQTVPFVGMGARRVVITHHDITERHQAQQRNREQAELLDAVGAAIIATDLEGIVTHWSDGAERLYGWRADEVMGRRDRSFINPSEERAQTDAIRHAMIDEDQWEGQLEVCRRDGTCFPAYVRDQWLRDAERSPSGVIGVLGDMTERVAMERRLRGARDFLATVTQTMPDGLFVLDVAGRV
ncbi:MAG: PAS domain S-box protein, partial [Solirubrobacteraceae bacterium]